MTGAQVLERRLVEKVWGRVDLPAPFRTSGGKPIGEAWFLPPPHFGQLLVKYLFTGERLSVQVHPSPEQALDGEAGKDECWLVLSAEPGARLAIGLREEVDAKTLRAAAVEGWIEDLLDWHDVAAGDFFYLPGGTIHAIGGGITLIEVQQNSDTTFRLFDYGRDRELHLDRAMAVARRAPHPPQYRQHAQSGSQCLLDGPHIRLDLVVGAPDECVSAAYRDGLLAVPIEGEIVLGGVVLGAGECGYSLSPGEIDFTGAKATLLARPA